LYQKFVHLLEERPPFEALWQALDGFVFERYWFDYGRVAYFLEVGIR
jgi:hypothetical protein